jgi:AAA domain, putative AbiEii toxin, Type IV TA system/AAA domain
MRLRQLQLHNYRSFGDATVDLENVTLLTGPNNAGKSMLLDAVRWLLSDPDRQVRDAAKRDWEDLAQRRRAAMPGPDDFDEWLNSDEPVWAVGIFDQLLEVERLRYRRYLVSGCLQLGAYIGRDFGEGPIEETRYFVLPEGHEGATGPSDPIYRLEGGWKTVAPPGRHEIWRPYREDLTLISAEPWEGTGLLSLDFSVPPLPVVVDFPGPEQAVPAARDLLSPFMERRVDDLVASLDVRLKEHLELLARNLAYDLGAKLNDIVPAYLSDSARLAVRTANKSRLREAFLSAVGDLEVHVSLGNGVIPEPWDPTENELPPGAEPLDAASAGLRRAVSLSTLELYADTDLWPATQPVMLLIDEPEVGLYPSAQRRLAKALTRLHDRSGVQALIVTHSPTLLNASSLSGIRVVYRRIEGDQDRSEVLLPPDLHTVTEALGATPADVLLGQCFVVVEGITEKAVLPRWARKLGIDLEREGIRLFAAEGWSNETTLARLADLVYPGACLHALLDGGVGPETERTKIMARFGDRVSVKTLAVTEIEGAYTESAVKRWIVANGGDPARATGFAAQAADGRAKKALTKLTHDEWHRTYKVVEDGEAIAEYMSVGEIDADIGGWLRTLVANN